MFEQAFKNIDDILRRDAGCTSELDYTEQTSWLLFLKYLDALEADKALEAQLEGREYSYILAEPYRWARECLGVAVRDAREWTCLRHSFTHFHLDITPVQLRLIEVLPVAVDAADRLWYNPCRPEAVGLAAPVTRLLGALQRHSGGDDDGPNG